MYLKQINIIWAQGTPMVLPPYFKQFKIYIQYSLKIVYPGRMTTDLQRTFVYVQP